MKQVINKPESRNFKGLQSMKCICKSYQNLNTTNISQLMETTINKAKTEKPYLKVCTIKDWIHGTQIKQPVNEQPEIWPCIKRYFPLLCILLNKSHAYCQNLVKYKTLGEQLQLSNIITDIPIQFGFKHWAEERVCLIG